MASTWGGTLAAGLGIGMQSMRSRIERIRGSLSIDSKPGATQLTVRILPERRGVGAAPG